MFFVFFFKQKTAYEMRISDWSSDVCSSDLATVPLQASVIGGQPQKTAISRSERHEAASRTPQVDWKVRAGLLDFTAFRAPRSHSLEIGRASCRERVCQYV